MFVKQLSFLAGANAADIVVGTGVSIILPSRANSQRARFGSFVAAVPFGEARRRAAKIPAR